MLMLPFLIRSLHEARIAMNISHLIVPSSLTACSQIGFYYMEDCDFRRIPNMRSKSAKYIALHMRTYSAQHIHGEGLLSKEVFAALVT